MRYEIDRRGALGDVRGDRVPVGQLRGSVERITLCGGYKARRLQSEDLILGRCLPIQQAVHLILRPRLQCRELILCSPGCDIDTPHLTADLISKDLELRTGLIDREIRFVRQVAVSHGARFDADIPADHPLGHVEIRPAIGADDVADAHLPGQDFRVAIGRSEAAFPARFRRKQPHEEVIKAIARVILVYLLQQELARRAPFGTFGHEIKGRLFTPEEGRGVARHVPILIIRRFVCR